MNEHFTKNRDKTDERMRQIQESNEVRLEQMRQTVEEKIGENLAAPLCRPPLRRFQNNWSRSTKAGRNADSGAGCRNP